MRSRVRRPDPTVPTLTVVVTGGIGVLVVIAFVAAVALSRGTSMSPGDRVAVVVDGRPAGITVLAGRCDDERVTAVELRSSEGVALWRIESAKGGIDRRYTVGQDPPPFGFVTVTPFRSLTAGRLRVEIAVDGVVDGESFDPAHLDRESAPRAPCGGDDVGVVSILFVIGALGVVAAYAVMVRRYLSARR